MPDFRAETEIALSAVATGLQIATRREGADAITFKGERDVVTATDVAVEDAVRAALARSGVPVIGEERGGQLPERGAYWLVDPICGTRNFAAGTPMFCVNAALVEDGVVIVAAVGDATTGELLCAEHGGGAWALTGDGRHRRLVSSEAAETIVLDDSKSKADRREQAARLAAAIIRRDRWDFRAAGTTLALPYLAAGRVSAYAVFEVPGLHGAPGTLLVTESGGVVTDIDGAPWTLESVTILAAASVGLHAELLAMARESAP